MISFRRVGSIPSLLVCRFNRTIKTLVIADNLISGSLDATRSAINAARQLGQPVSLLLVGETSVVDKVVPLFKGTAHLEKIFVARGENFKNCFPEEVDILVKSHFEADTYSRILLAHTAYGRELAPRIAALLKLNQVSDAIELSDSHCVRGIYAGNVVVKHCIKNQPRLVITIRQSHFEPKLPTSDPGQNVLVENIALVDKVKNHAAINKILIKNEQSSITSSTMPELASAETVICGGRAFKTAENFKMVYELASHLNAAVASTRAAVDSNIAPSNTQVGQTGKIVSPSLYMALGVSGAVQHITGMSNSKTVVAINNDIEAPIFDHSNYGLVGDIFKVVPELIKKLECSKKIT